ncbi:uncharacterized protein PV09_08441 [Verruconis gallopava]|uniref:Uncharacterized protein n=1 Tax=Verruconis gallopava TaxID=253628 RepID=A0A0D2A0T9_9PEZI|nr:uncharacterized protein PV09_08441 [Verruconis gallopava]KIV99914.1 hypothetical protein PV09_08441 [Verruconis gallopava]
MLKSYAVAPVERLPCELIQHIFLLTDMDTNLPRASPLLSRSLLDQYILLKYCERAFARPSNSNQAVNYRERLERRQRQIKAFSMNWMTWSFFSSFLIWWKERSAAADMGHLDPGQFELELSDEKRQLQARRSNLSCPWLPEIVCPLPNKLLRGPFTPEKLAFIRCLLSISNASVDWASKESVRLSTAAKVEAILERNFEAVHLLSRNRRLAKAPNLELVKFAVIEGGCDRSIVFELMTAARQWGLRRWVDVELDAWVAREIAKGNPKARWLRLKLEELRFGNYPDPKTGDYAGDGLMVKRTTQVETNAIQEL